MSSFELSLPFTARGLGGTIRASLRRNEDPLTIGSPSWARDFPVCHTMVDFEGAGYTALFGWVQLVRIGAPRDDSTRVWVTDPLEVYEGLDTPFGFYGVKPDLFDAPARSDRSRPLDWHAESYLCVSPANPMSREVQPVAAFSWGFILEGGDIGLTKPEQLPLSEWEKHDALLATHYPTWHFQPPRPGGMEATSADHRECSGTGGDQDI